MFAGGPKNYSYTTGVTCDKYCSQKVHLLNNNCKAMAAELAVGVQNDDTVNSVKLSGAPSGLHSIDTWKQDASWKKSGGIKNEKFYFKHDI